MPYPIPNPNASDPARDEAAQTRTSSLESWLDAELPELLALYRQLHQQPELSFQEVRTAAALADQLRRCGARVEIGIGGLGVVGSLINGPGPTVMLRTDLDALPIREATGLEFASTAETVDTNGRRVAVMHACGHDLHIANLVGAARLLTACRDRWSGTVLLVGQPAEERGVGAAAMLADGLFDRYGVPDAALAVHVAADLPAGQIGLAAGPITSHVDTCEIELFGCGSHGAYPHRSIDPIVQAAHLINDLQTIVSREIPPTDPAVLTVGSIHAGTAPNVIADTCQLGLTLRCRSTAVRRQLQEAIARKCAATAMAAGADTPRLTFDIHVPALHNDKDLVESARDATCTVLGPDAVVPYPATMGAEDFAFFGEAGARLCLLRLGAVAPERMRKLAQDGRSPPPLHSPRFHPDAEPTLRAGVPVLAATAMSLLERRGEGPDPAV